ncbi:MAG: TetR/AcrR family transcriptional regulator C-terminal domain-containing protein [Actinobacteria bacterium]|nr:TetR/AcrR family transcriptional regulator C-terminal domain-containing protein [Actinomycetota bacterium]
MSSPKPRVKKTPPPRTPLNTDRVVRAAIALADKEGIDSLNMRELAQALNVVPMAIYKHVANKEELLDAMVDVIVSEIDPPNLDVVWKEGVRQRILSAREALLRHPWVPRVIETRTHASLIVLDYMNSLTGIFRSGGFTVDLTHHVMHALGSRMWGFMQEVFPTETQPDVSPQELQKMFDQLAQRFPYLIEMAQSKPHDKSTGNLQGCDDQFEFEFALDALLERFEQLHTQGWSSFAPKGPKNRSLETLAREKKVKK